MIKTIDVSTKLKNGSTLNFYGVYDEEENAHSSIKDKLIDVLNDLESLRITLTTNKESISMETGDLKNRSR